MMNDPLGEILDPGLATAGRERIEWAWREMPVLKSLQRRFSIERPLDGLRISACLHITTETASLARTLKVGGADVVLCASNPLSTQDDVAASLVREGRRLAAQVYPVPKEIDEEVARLKLTAMNLAIDTLNTAQEKYLSSRQEGTT